MRKFNQHHQAFPQEQSKRKYTSHSEEIIVAEKKADRQHNCTIKQSENQRKSRMVSLQLSTNDQHFTNMRQRYPKMSSNTEKKLVMALFAIMEKSINLLFGGVSLLESKSQLPIIEVLGYEEVEDYILSGQSPIPQGEVENCIQLIQDFPILRNYLQWIYDTCPQIYQQDLLLGGYLIARSWQLAKIQNIHWRNSPTLLQNLLINFGSRSSSFQFIKLEMIPNWFGGVNMVVQPQTLSLVTKFIELTIQRLSKIDIQIGQELSGTEQEDCSQDSGSEMMKVQATKGKKIKKTQRKEEK